MRRETDSGDLASRLQTLVWSLVVGAVGGLVGLLLSGLTGWAPLPAMLAGFVVSSVAVYLIVTAVSGVASDTAATIYSPSARAPVLREYSLAESMIARGRFEEAAAELCRAAEAYPAEAEPVLRLARLYRDRMNRLEDAVAQFRQARDISGDTAVRNLAVRELVELLERRLDSPSRALPELARAAEQESGTPMGDWAKLELARVKASLQGRAGE